MGFVTIEEVEKHYGDAIARAGSDFRTVDVLKSEKAAALTELRLRALAERERAVWLRDALHDFPLAGEFKDQVAGETEAEVRDAAKRMHERLAGLFESYSQRRRREALIEAQLAAENQPPEEGDAEPVQQP